MYNGNILLSLIEYLNANALLFSPAAIGRLPKEEGISAEPAAATERRYLSGDVCYSQPVRFHIKHRSGTVAIGAANSLAAAGTAEIPFVGAQRIRTTSAPEYIGMNGEYQLWTVTVTVWFMG